MESYCFCQCIWDKANQTERDLALDSGVVNTVEADLPHGNQRAGLSIIQQAGVGFYCAREVPELTSVERSREGQGGDKVESLPLICMTRGALWERLREEKRREPERHYLLLSGV